jgi:hypothetical protein
MSDFLIYGMLLVGCLVLVSNFIDFQGLIAKLIFKPSLPTNNPDKETTFLSIVGLWYQLKMKCDSMNLKVASEKLDEVFPLLNGILENDENA